MADIIGRIATPLESSRKEPDRDKRERRKKDSTDEDGKEYFKFRFVENHGKAGSPNRKTTWYDVRATIPREHAKRLYVGQVVKIRGRLDPEAYLKTHLLGREAIPKTWAKMDELLDRFEALAISNVFLTTSVVPCALTGEEL